MRVSATWRLRCGIRPDFLLDIMSKSRCSTIQRTNFPAIDSGSAMGAPNDDFDGNSRPQDGDGTATYDIGAYEAPFYSEWAYLPLVLK